MKKPAFRLSHTRRFASAMLCTLATASCTLAPTATKIDSPVPSQWTGPVSAKTAAHADDWQTATPADETERGQWWLRFNDAELHALEIQLRSGNFNLQIAVARYDRVRAAADYAGSSLWPHLGADAAYSRKRDAAGKPPSGSGAGVNPYSDALLRAQLSYEIDLWGRLRNVSHAADYRQTAAQADLISARLSLEAELAQNYFQARALDSQVQWLSELSSAYARSAALTERRYLGGIARASDVDQSRVQLNSVQTLLAEATLQRRQTQNAIAILVGQTPEDFSLPVRSLDSEAPEIPAGLPSQLLQRRPDIASAERRVAAANADIGSARAAWFPTFSLNASGGYENGGTSGWLLAPNRFWAAGPVAALTLFDAGARRAQTDTAWAGYHEAVATYRQQVIDAYREVENNLAATALLASERASQRAAATAALRNQQQTELRYQGGIAVYTEVVVAQDAAFKAQQAEIIIHLRQLTTAVQLIKALGGDWTGLDSIGLGAIGLDATESERNVTKS